MPIASLKKSLAERQLDADVRSRHWLAEGNAASEIGDAALAEKCYAKAQFWLDRWNFLCGRGERPAPEAMLDRLDDVELNAVADARAGQKRVRVKLDEL